MRRLVLALMAVGLGVACGGGGGGDSGAGDGGQDAIPVEANEYGFVPEEITAPAGDVTFENKNTGSLEHDFTIDKPKFKLKALAGQTKSGEVKLEAGTYDVYCSVTGHQGLGMEGKLTVE